MTSDSEQQALEDPLADRPRLCPSRARSTAADVAGGADAAGVGHQYALLSAAHEALADEVERERHHEQQQADEEQAGVGDARRRPGRSRPPARSSPRSSSGRAGTG